MNFNMKQIHTIYESDVNDQAEANIDNTLRSADLMEIFDNICPITGGVYKAMKNAAADPQNLKVTVSKNGEGEKASLFIEAVEFMTYVEACGKTIGEAADDIVDTYQTDIPGMASDDIHIVFPSDALNKNNLGSQNYGRDVKNDWAMQLMTGIRRYGLKANIGVEESK